MLEKIIQTNIDYTDLFIFVLRLALGLVILPHGMQKLLGWYGGFGFKGTMGYFTQTLHIPYAFGLLAIIAEFFGSLGLILGFLTRPAALGIGVTMLVAAYMGHRKFGFFMNWFGNKKGEGFEYFVLAVSIAAVLVITGAGNWSLDALLSHTIR